MTIFSKIIQNHKEENYRILKLTDDFLVMLSLNPVTKGHTLVIPVQETDNLVDLQLAGPLFELSIKWADKITKKLKAQAYTLKINNKLYLLEEKGHVNHLHMHIIPRYDKKDSINEFPEKVNNQELKTLKDKILK